MQVRWWPFLVVLIDMLLVVEAPRYLTKWVVGAAIAWLLVIEVEFMTRDMSLFDLPESGSYDSRREGWCSCARPPCAHHSPLYLVNNLAGYYFVFLLDFFLTRGFADKVLAEKGKMAAAVCAAENIAASLAGFDLEMAGACLAAAEDDLPRDLHASLRQLLENLGSYKPYLPQSMLMGPGDDDSCESGNGSLLSPQPRVTNYSWNTPLSEPTSTTSASSTRFASGLSAGVQFTSFTLSPAPITAALNRLYRKAVTVVQLALKAPDLSTPEACEAFGNLHAAFLGAVLSAAMQHRGIVDTFTGASVQATFNASRPTAGPAAKALAMVNALRGDDALPACSGAVVLGPAVTGVLGTQALRRPTVMGEAPDLAVDLAKYAKAAGVAFVCNTGLFLETSAQHPMRVVMDRVFFGNGKQVVAYEILHPAKGSREGGEWMYELQAAGGFVWEAYNDAGRRQLLGQERAGDPEAWARAAEEGRAGRRWDFAPRVEVGEVYGADAVSEEDDSAEDYPLSHPADKSSTEMHTGRRLS